MPYMARWRGFDPGREGVGDPAAWVGVLRILSQYEGERVHNRDSEMYEALEESFPEISWLGENEDRSFFRDYQQLWTLSGVMVPTREAEHQIRLTQIGRDLLAERLSLEAVWIQAMASHEEALEGEGGEVPERPFAVLSEAFLDIGGEGLTLEEVYFGVMKGWRPGDGPLATVVQGLPEGQEMDATRRRRLRAMLKLMEQVGAIQERDGRRYAGDADLLQAIADGRTIQDLEELGEGLPPQPEDSDTERELDALAEEMAGLPTEPREKVFRAIALRRGQPGFRKRLLNLYGGRCAISRWDAERALEAAHIVPWAGGGGNSPRNGVLLRADLHTLFDLRYVSIDPGNWTVVVAESLRATRYRAFQGEAVLLPKSRADRPAPHRLEAHLREMVP